MVFNRVLRGSKREERETTPQRLMAANSLDDSGFGLASETQKGSLHLENRVKAFNRENGASSGK